MNTILFNINDPEHREALEGIFLKAFEKFSSTGSTGLSLFEASEKWTTEDVCRYFGGIKPATVYKYIREGLPYTPGRPNTFRRKDVLEWDEKRKRSRKGEPG